MDKITRKKILLIDDEDPLRALVAATLDGFVYDLFEARDGREGLEIAFREKPDLILLDIAMPGMDGFQVCSQIKINPLTKDTPIIILSAMRQDNDRHRGLVMGASSYLTKPFSPRVLLKLVDELLETEEEKDSSG